MGQETGTGAAALDRARRQRGLDDPHPVPARQLDLDMPADGAVPGTGDRTREKAAQASKGPQLETWNDWIWRVSRR